MNQHNVQAELDRIDANYRRTMQRMDMIERMYFANSSCCPQCGALNSSAPEGIEYQMLEGKQHRRRERDRVLRAKLADNALR